jgi:hypothetical protein
MFSTFLIAATTAPVSYIPAKAVWVQEAPQQQPQKPVRVNNNIKTVDTAGRAVCDLRGMNVS